MRKKARPALSNLLFSCWFTSLLIATWSGWRRGNAFDEGLGVERSADFGVIVEIDEDVAGFGFGWFLFADFFCGRLAAGSPGLNPVGPLIEGLGVVAAGVEDFGAVKAAIDEVRGDIGNFRPFDRVGADNGHVVFAEKFEEFWNGKAGVANFDGVAQLVMVIHIFERNPFTHPFIVV